MVGESSWYLGEKNGEKAGRVMDISNTIGRVRLGPKVALAVLAMALAGCSSVPDYLNPMTLFEDDTPAAENAGEAATRASAEQLTAEVGSTPYPALSSVPGRPAAPLPGLRERVVEGLVADRTNARYTADAVKAEAARAMAPDGTAPVLPASGGPTTSIEAGAPVVRPASGPTVASQAAKAVKAPAPPALQEAVARAPAASSSAVPLPPIPQAPGGGEVVRVRIPGNGERAPDKSAGEVVAGGPVDPSKAALDAGEMMQLATIQFGNNSTKLDQRDEEILRQVVALQQQTGGMLRVVGHASSGASGNTSRAQEQANMTVSLRRANAVAQALVQYGLNPAVIHVEGLSDQAPLYDGTTPSGEAGNRRTEIYLVL